MAAGHFRYDNPPAGLIIRRLGGVRAVAASLKVSAEAVSKWNRPQSQGGYGGRIPARWWLKVLDLVETRGGRAAKEQTYKDLCATVKPKEDPMVHASKRKGDRFERQVVDDLNEAGVPSKRVPLSGAAPGWDGDVLAQGIDGEWKIQCKITTNKEGGSAGRGAITRFLNQVDFGIVSAGKDRYVAMTQNVFVAMLKGAPPAAVNVPQLTLPKAKLVAAAIEGHDALVFRRDQAKEWYALVREDK